MVRVTRRRFSGDSRRMSHKNNFVQAIMECIDQQDMFTKYVSMFWAYKNCMLVAVR